MVLLRRILPFLSPVLLGGCSIGMMLYPELWQVWVIVVVLLVLFTVGYMVQWKFRTSQLWISLFTTMTLALGGIGFLIFVERQFYQWLTIISVVVLYGLYIENLFIFYYLPRKATHFSLPNMSFFIMIIGGFLLFSFAFAMQLIRLIPFWCIVLLGMIYSMSMMYVLLQSYTVWKKEQFPILLAVGFLLGELVVVLQFWPTSYFVNGMIVAILLYCVPSLIQLDIRHLLTRKTLFRYLAVSAAAFIVILSTSQWS